jgi:ubiquinone/menaquinone biosynthesis C-methylase UbiE
MSELLRDTQQAFDSVAVDYDGPLGNNALIQRIRSRTMDVVQKNFPPGGHLLDLGCGTGLDAVFLASTGYKVTAIDWSAEMAKRTKSRVIQAGLQATVEVGHLGFHQLNEFRSELFDGVYSDLGALNCAANIDETAALICRILKPQGKLIASVMGRACPWEWILYSSKGQWQRARLRFTRDLTPVPLNGQRVWTRYFAPSDFESIFAKAGFRLSSLRALGLFLPPPYMIGFSERHPRLIDFLQKLDDSMGQWPIFRQWGDHFLIVMQKND